MGGGMARVLASRDGVKITGAISRTTMVGEDLGEGLGLKPLGVTVSNDAGATLAEARPDLTVIATSSFISDVAEQIYAAVDFGSNVISIAEEMAYPAASSPEVAGEMDRRAKERGVSILGTGINPGFILDALIIALTGACTEVKSIRAERVNDLSPFGPTVMRTQGVGTTPEEFEAGLEDGTVVGHVGFNESMHLIASALGWHLDRVEQTRTPIVAGETREGQSITVPAGRVAGCHHSARGYVGGEEVITLEHPQQVNPGAARVETGDYIEISGTPGLSLAIQPEIPGGVGTIALAVNMVAPLVAASPGLKTMADLPLPRALLGNVREMTDQLKDVR